MCRAANTSCSRSAADGRGRAAARAENMFLSPAATAAAAGSRVVCLPAGNRKIAEEGVLRIPDGIFTELLIRKNLERPSMFALFGGLNRSKRFKLFLCSPCK